MEARLLRCKFTLGCLCWFDYCWWFGWHWYFIYYWFPWRVASFWSSEFFDSTIPALLFLQAGMPTSISVIAQFLIVHHFCAESNRFPSGRFWPVFNTAHVCWDYQILLVYGWLYSVVIFWIWLESMCLASCQMRLKGTWPSMEFYLALFRN